jgi:hypothetical protein
LKLSHLTHEVGDVDTRVVGGQGMELLAKVRAEARDAIVMVNSDIASVESDLEHG